MQPMLFLIPVTLGDTELSRVLPEYNRDIIRSLSHFIVENIRTARRFLKKAVPEMVIDDLVFFELNKHTTPEMLSGYIRPLEQGVNMGLLSEAGCPAIADPGADIVDKVQQKGYKVVPLTGPSSILLSLMGSGFNGQSFAFLGYLPIDPGARQSMLKKIESRIYGEDQTQIFIETPYRNIKMVEDIIKSCKPSTRLCIACNLTCVDEMIQTRSVREWSGKIPDINKKPAIFLLYK